MSDEPTVVGALLDQAETITRVRVSSTRDDETGERHLCLEVKVSADGELWRLLFLTPAQFEAFGDELFAAAQVTWPGRFDQ